MRNGFLAVMAGVTVLAAAPAMADTSDLSPRFERLGMIPGVTQPLMRGLAGASMPVLSVIERMRLQSGRTRLYPVDLGFGSLTFGITRYRGGSALTDGFYDGMGRFKAQAVGADFAMPLVGGLMLRSEGSVTRITRRYANSFSSRGIRGGVVSQMGVGLSLRGVALMADWVRPQMQASSSQRRWREQVGFVPPARDLFHLGLTTHADQADRGQWSLTATAVNRAASLSTSSLIASNRAFSGTADRRIEAGYRLTF